MTPNLLGDIVALLLIVGPTLATLVLVELLERLKER